MSSLPALGSLVQRFVDPAPGMPLVLACVLAMAVPVALLHELGHALVAARRLGGSAHISLRGTGALVRVRLRRLTMVVAALPHSAGMPGYRTLEESRASARDLLLVALAGPAVSLLGFTLAALALSSARVTGVAHDSLWAAAATNLLAALLTLTPLELQGRRGAPKLRTDGRVALLAVRAGRSFRACERAQAKAIPGSTST
jgi:hypothetical protein